MKEYNVCHWSLYLDGLIHTWTASSSLQIKPRVLPKDKILILISKFNFITEKIQRQFLVICLQIWTSWNRIQVAQLFFFLYIYVLYIVSDILTNFYQDPIIRSTKKSLVTDTCNKSPPTFTIFF